MREGIHQREREGEREREREREGGGEGRDDTVRRVELGEQEGEMLTC